MMGIKKNHKSISFFMRILLGYFAILIVPAITGIISYYTSSRIVRNEISVSNNALLDYGLQEIDLQLANSNEAIYDILYSPELSNCVFNELSSTKYDAYSELKLHKYLESLKESYIADIMVFFNISDRIVSSSLASLDSKTYFDSYYKTKGGESYQKWASIFYKNPCVTTTHKQENLPTLSIVQKYPQNQIKSKATIVIVFDRYLLNQFLQNLIGEEGKTFIITDKDNNALITVPDNIDYQKFKKDNNINEAKWNNSKGYVYQSKQSFDNSISYVCITPNSVFWRKMQSLRNIDIICYGIFIIVSTMAVILISRIAYKPFQSFLAGITQSSNIAFNRQERSEMDYLNQVFSITMKEKEQLKNRMESEKTVLIDDIIMKSLQGIINMDQDMIETLKSYNIDILFTDFVIAVIKIDAWNKDIIPNLSEDRMQNMIRTQITAIIEKVFGLENTCYVTRTERRNYVCIINTVERDRFSDNATVSEGFTAIKNLLEKQIGISCTFGISKRFEDKKSLHEGFLQASEAMEYRAAFGRGIVMHYQDIEKRKFSYSSSNITAQKKMISFIKDKNHEGNAMQLINHMIQCNMDEDTATLEAFKCFRLDMVNIIANVMNDICTPLYISENTYIDGLMSCETFLDFKIRLGMILEALQRYETEYQNENDSGKIVMQYITEHYANPDLNINMLGVVFDLSPSYLSKLFKDQHGMSPNEFITKLRINEAKELIEAGELTIEQIAEKVGFLSSSVFIRTFKKVEGITPGAYKKIKKI
ncbi:MAG TPA: AraC family transcriptional regulator [Mobilitalea sp.]|nr:AraC family transcriptional regulator [Mobilitalea sp.]